MELLWFAAWAFVIFLILRYGFRMLKKEQEGRRALAKKLADDATALVNETEAWMAKEWNRRFKGGAS